MCTPTGSARAAGVTTDVSLTRHYYFAYGSNMNPARVERRRMPFVEHHGGVLDGFRLAFNKRSVKVPGAASANVMAADGHRVEGVLYRLADGAGIEFMDPFEGYPVRYRREILPVTFGTDVFEAWVYLANRDYIEEGLQPARWYLDHLLEGRPHLSENYYRRLLLTECMPDSDVEPE